MTTLRPVTTRRSLTFSSPVLEGFEWPVIDIVAPLPGAKICVLTGIHVNEVSSIEACFRLTKIFSDALKTGSVSLMPVANLPALEPRSEYICPVDGKNINFSFPGSPDGSFSEALADALLTEWAHDADCLIDLHGGDLRENVAQFNVVPLTGDSAFDDVNISLAKAFDPQIIVTIEAARLGEPGRSCSARAQRKQYSAFAEAGANGLPDESSIEFHKNGVLRVAHYFEMIDQIATEGVRQTSVGDLYVWQSACSSGWCTYLIEPGESVLEGQMVATIRSMSGDAEQPVYADATGSILWRNTHPIITKDLPLFGIAFSSLPKQITEKRP